MRSAESKTFGTLLGQFRNQADLSQEKLARLMNTTRQTIWNWEHDVYQPRERKLVLALAKYLRLNDQHRDELLEAANCPPVGTIWKLPFKQNPFFTGREEVLRTLAERLVSDQTVALKQPQALKGLGRVGKTAMAVEYAHRYRSAYQAILWAPARSADTLNASLVAIAEGLRLPERGAQRQEDVIKAVKKWLLDHSDWLLILDDVEDWSIVETLYPWAHQGHVLITTCSQFTGTMLALTLECMDSEEGAWLLLRRAKLMDPQEGRERATQVREYEQAKELSHILGGLPLALDQAGAFVEETGCSLAEYRVLFEQAKGALLRRRGMKATEHLDSVAVTFELAFAKVQQASPAAAELLRLCAFLAPEQIPEELFTKGNDVLPAVLREVLALPLSWQEIVGVLRSYSLLEREGETKTLSVHRLVQDVLHEVLDKDTQRQWAERAVQATSKAFPSALYSTWEQCQRLLPHALVCAKLIDQWNFIFDPAALLLNQTGYYLKERGQYSEALPLLQGALAVYKQTHTPASFEVTTALGNVAEIYTLQHQLPEALSLIDAVLARREQDLGSTHPLVLSTLNNKANIYAAQERYDEALAMLEQILALSQQSLGSDHLDVATYLNNKAMLLMKKDRVIEAEILLHRARRIREQKLGLDHPVVAEILGNLAENHRQQKRLTKAIPLARQALTISEKTLGKDHPGVAPKLNNLAGYHYFKGEYREAQQYYERALIIMERVFPTHPNTTACMEGLAAVMYKLGKSDQARKLEIRARALRANRATS